MAWILPKGAGSSRWTELLLPDGGASFAPLAAELPGALEQLPITLPAVVTTRARIRVLAIEGSVGTAVLGDGLSDFTIGANVGSAIDISFVSSEKVSQNWVDTSSPVPFEDPAGAMRCILL